jgi:hypothetical protein
MNRLLRQGNCVVVVLLVLGEVAAVSWAAESRKTENIIYVMVDGFRWQELFGGPEAAILDTPDSHGKKLEGPRTQYLRETPEASREAIMPFFWSVVAKEGQVYGNQNKQSVAQLTNGLKFSFPGYNETLCGYPDPRIDSNTPGPNPNVTVLEWLHCKPAYQGKVAAFGAWDAFNNIFNRERCGFCVNAGYDPLAEGVQNPTVELLNALKVEAPRLWDGEPVDALTFHTALEYFKALRPRVFYLSFGETDEWGHGKRYDEYLASAHRSDAFLKTLWETAQAMPEYRGKTSLIFSTDHGRGNGKQWTDHGKDIVGAEDIWMAFLGPDTPALGERANVPAVTQSQIAATLAALLGEDYVADVPKAGKPIVDVIRP